MKVPWTAWKSNESILKISPEYSIGELMLKKIVGGRRRGQQTTKWLDLLAVQGTLKSLLQHHSSKPSILQRSAFFIVQLSHLRMTPGKTTALTRWAYVGKVISLLFNMLSRLVRAFLPRSKHLLFLWTPKSLQMVTAAVKLKDVYSLEGNL